MIPLPGSYILTHVTTLKNYVLQQFSVFQWLAKWLPDHWKTEQNAAILFLGHWKTKYQNLPYSNVVSISLCSVFDVGYSIPHGTLQVADAKCSCLSTLGPTFLCNKNRPDRGPLICSKICSKKFKISKKVDNVVYAQ